MLDNNRTTKVPLCPGSNGSPSGASALKLDFSAPKSDTTKDEPRKAGPVDPKMIHNYVCPSGTSPYGNEESGGFCCSGKVSSDGLSCSGGATCAFPDNNKGGKIGPCEGGFRYACPIGTIPYGDLQGGFCCTGVDDKKKCKGQSCAFPTNPSKGSMPACTGALERDTSILRGQGVVIAAQQQVLPVSGGSSDQGPSTTFAIGDIKLSCPKVGSDFKRHVSIRLPGLKMSWKGALPVLRLLLGVAEFELPEAMGKLGKIATIKQIALDYHPVPGLAVGRVLATLTDIKLDDQISLVNVTGTVAYDMENGVSFDLSGSGVLPIFKGGIAFNMPLIVEGDIIPLKLATQQRMVTLGSMLTALKANDMLAKLPDIPLLSGGLKDLLTIQIRDIGIVFCKTTAANCTERLSINVQVPGNMTQFESGMLPINLQDVVASVMILDPFTPKKRTMEVKMVGKWSVDSSTPVVLTVVRAPSQSSVVVSDDTGEEAGDESLLVRHRLVERNFEPGLSVGHAEYIGTEEEQQWLLESDEEEDGLDHHEPYDHWVAYPDVGSFSFFNMPLAHVNHHILGLHRFNKRAESNGTAKSAKTSKSGKHKKLNKTEIAKKFKKPPRKAGILIPPGSAGKWLIAGGHPSIDVNKIISSLSAELFPTGSAASLIENSGLKNIKIQNASMVSVLNQKDLVFRVSGVSNNVLPDAEVYILLSRQPKGAFSGSLVMALNADTYATLLGRLVPGFAISGLKLMTTGSTVSEKSIIPLFVFVSTCGLLTTTLSSVPLGGAPHVESGLGTCQHSFGAGPSVGAHCRDQARLLHDCAHGSSARLCRPNFLRSDEEAHRIKDGAASQHDSEPARRDSDCGFERHPNFFGTRAEIRHVYGGVPQIKFVVVGQPPDSNGSEAGAADPGRDYRSQRSQRAARSGSAYAVEEGIWLGSRLHFKHYPRGWFECRFGRSFAHDWRGSGNRQRVLYNLGPIQPERAVLFRTNLRQRRPRQTREKLVRW